MSALHHRQHPSYVEGCWGCRVASVSFAASAMPSRAGGAEALATNERERRWDRDRPAYKRLRQDGLQPRSIVGAAAVEARANHPKEVETGRKLHPEAIRIAEESAV